VPYHYWRKKKILRRKEGAAGECYRSLRNSGAPPINKRNEGKRAGRKPGIAIARANKKTSMKVGQERKGPQIVTAEGALEQKKLPERKRGRE